MYIFMSYPKLNTPEKPPPRSSNEHFLASRGNCWVIGCAATQLQSFLRYLKFPLILHPGHHICFVNMSHSVECVVEAHYGFSLRVPEEQGS